MKKRTVDIVELSNVYDVAEGIWWIDRESFASKLEIRSFIANTDEWNKWAAAQVNIEYSYHSIRSNDNNLKLRRLVGTWKNDKNILFSWKTNPEVGKGKVQIQDFMVYYHRDLSPYFEASMVEDMLNPLKLEEEKKSKVYMVVQRHHGLDLQDFDIEIPTMDIETNYGTEWAEKHTKLLESLMFGKKKGIALLHGLPGTGKSMYIRHLIATLSESKTVVYLPNQLINNITDPSFIPLMAEYSGAILVIEDADEAIKSRKAGGGIVDKLLNLADGIISDFLGMQIICTFNNDISTIDDALLRKGRLILKHQFEKLPVESAQKLSDKLGFKTTIEDPMTLAEIYNQEDTLSDIKETKQKIGFR